MLRGAWLPNDEPTLSSVVVDERQWIAHSQKKPVAWSHWQDRILANLLDRLAERVQIIWATGPLTGGLIFDTLGSYAWLYIGSFGLGIGAFLIAMTFKPFPKPQPQLSPAQ